jgi:hypothetical protein
MCKPLPPPPPVNFSDLTGPHHAKTGSVASTSLNAGRGRAEGGNFYLSICCMSRSWASLEPSFHQLLDTEQVVNQAGC